MPCFSLRAVNVLLCYLCIVGLVTFKVRARAWKKPQKLCSFITLVPLVINFKITRLLQSSVWGQNSTDKTTLCYHLHSYWQPVLAVGNAQLRWREKRTILISVITWLFIKTNIFSSKSKNALYRGSFTQRMPFKPLSSKHNVLSLKVVLFFLPHVRQTKHAGGCI